MNDIERIFIVEPRIDALKETIVRIQTAGSYLESAEFNHPVNVDICKIIKKLRREIAYLEKLNKESEV